MYAIKATYDGNHFKPEEPFPVEGKYEYELVITFTKPINTSQEEILKYFNPCNDKDVKNINDIVEERKTFLLVGKKLIFFDTNILSYYFNGNNEPLCPSGRGI
ncbi:MAG: hypothetical protein LBP19_00505 [Treponema sp.]|jgi:hypothetical protein|nr:hypothetical protein [Treponema sp.]